VARESLVLNDKDRRNLGQEHIRSAKILIGEELYDEAKKSLWKALRLDVKNIEAEQLLKTIEDLEIRNILNDSNADLTHAVGTKKERVDVASAESRLESILDVLKSEKLDSGDIVIDSELQDVDFDTLCDLSVAMIELGDHSRAQSILTSIRRETLSTEEKVKHGEILATSFLESGKSYESASLLEEVIRDSETDGSAPINLFYLHAIALSKLNDIARALDVFSIVEKREPGFRDVRMKIAEILDKI